MTITLSEKSLISSKARTPDLVRVVIGGGSVVHRLHHTRVRHWRATRAGSRASKTMKSRHLPNGRAARLTSRRWTAASVVGVSHWPDHQTGREGT